MAYKYVNPGYGELLDRAGTTVNDTKINAVNGVAFFNNSNDRSVTFPEPLTNVWIKLSMERAYVSGIISVTGTGWPTGVRLDKNDYIKVFFSGNEKDFTTKYADKASIDFIMHVRSGVNDGIIEVWMNGDKVAVRQGNCYDGKPFNGVWLKTESEKNYFFNVIIADYDISHEEVVTARLTEPEGTWKGIGAAQAEASDVNQVLTQKIDTDDLEKKILARSESICITGVTLSARDIHFNSDKVNALTGTVNDGEKDVYSSTQKISGASMVYGMSYIKDMTLDEVKAASFSLKSAKV